MAPEYGATIGFFPIDDETLSYLPLHRPRSRATSRWSRRMRKAQGIFRTADTPEPEFSDTLELDLGDGRAEPRGAEAPAGPRAPPHREGVVEGGARPTT